MYFGVVSPQQAFLWVIFSLDLFCQVLGFFSLLMLPVGISTDVSSLTFPNISTPDDPIMYYFSASDSKLRIMCLLPLSFSPQVFISNSSLCTIYSLNISFSVISSVISSIVSLPKNVPRVLIFYHFLINYHPMSLLFLSKLHFQKISHYNPFGLLKLYSGHQ